jgi:hypothetical protein
LSDQGALARSADRQQQVAAHHNCTGQSSRSLTHEILVKSIIWQSTHAVIAREWRTSSYLGQCTRHKHLLRLPTEQHHSITASVVAQQRRK